MGRRRSLPAPPSPLADALARVGDRWTLLLVAALLDGEKRFNELQDELDGIAPNVLTASGRELAGALRLLADWGARSGGDGEPLRHTACGTALEARWWCPNCETIVDDAVDDVI